MSTFNLKNLRSLGFYSMDMIYAKLESTGISIPGEFVLELDAKAKAAGVQEVELFVPKYSCGVNAKDCHPEVVLVCSEKALLGDDGNPDKCHEVLVCDQNGQNCQYVMECDNTMAASVIEPEAIQPKGCRPVVIVVCDEQSA
jgi:hypothetical protein